MTAVMIGVDPHKGSHTAVAIDAAEEPLGRLRVRASAGQAQRLVAWAAAWPERTWAVEGAGGLGHLLAQQLVAAGERVLDVQPKLGARVRLLATGASNKNDPNDALSVAVAALRSRTRRQVSADDHATVLKVWSRRHRDLGRAKNQVACRLHAVLRAGARRRARGDHRSSRRPYPPVSHAVRHCRAGPRRARRRAAGGHAPPGCPDPRVEEEAGHRGQGLGHQPDRHLRRRPVIAATVIGDVADVARFATRDRFAAYNGTAPIEVSSGNRKTYRLSLRGNRRVNHALHMAAITQIRHPHSDGRAYYERKVAEGKTHKEALRCLKRRISDAVYARLQADAQPAARAVMTGPGGQPGNDSDSSAAGSHPARQLFGKPLPGPPPRHYDPAPRPGHPQRKSARPLDSALKEVSICAPVRSVGLAARAAPNSYSVALCPPGSADARRRRPPCPMRSPDLTDPTSAHLRSAGSSRP